MKPKQQFNDGQVANDAGPEADAPSSKPASAVRSAADLAPGISPRESDLVDFVDTAGVGLHWVSGDGTILWANRVDYELLGYGEAQYVGRNIREFHAEPEVIESIMGRLGRGERLTNLEARLRCKDGSIRHVLISSSGRFDDHGGFLHTRCFTVDVTDKVSADRNLRQADERLRVALEAGRMGAWQWEIDSGRVSWTPTLESIHGLSAGSFPGTFEAFQADIHPDDRARVLKAIAQALSDGSDHHLEYRIVRPDGETRWLETHGKVISNELGRVSSMIGVCRDVTTRKNNELVLTRQAEELRQVGEFRETFLGVVAHELRSPLGVIQTSADLLLQSDGLAENYRRTAMRIAGSSKRMGKMIGELLDFVQGRLGTGLRITVAECDMGEIVQGIVEELEVIHPTREITLRRNGDLRGNWDVGRIGQVISNLVSNALTHGQGPVEVLLEGTDDAVTLVVKNRGTPIPPDAQSTLFTPFWRASNRAEGLGLGLFIVSEIVRAHGGSIAVESSEATGTSFIVRWPRSSVTST